MMTRTMPPSTRVVGSPPYPTHSHPHRESGRSSSRERFAPFFLPTVFCRAEVAQKTRQRHSGWAHRWPRPGTTGLRYRGIDTLNLVGADSRLQKTMGNFHASAQATMAAGGLDLGGAKGRYRENPGANVAFGIESVPCHRPAATEVVSRRTRQGRDTEGGLLFCCERNFSAGG